VYRFQSGRDVSPANTPPAALANGIAARCTPPLEVFTVSRVISHWITGADKQIGPLCSPLRDTALSLVISQDGSEQSATGREHLLSYQWVELIHSVTVSIAFGGSQLILACATLYHEDYVPTAWQTLLVYWASLLGSMLINLFFAA
jgi:hypothetical protein